MYWNRIFVINREKVRKAEPSHLMYWNNAIGSLPVAFFTLNHHIWCIEIQHALNAFFCRIVLNHHIWCIEIRIYNTHNAYFPLLNHHIWCIEIIKTAWDYYRWLSLNHHIWCIEICLLSCCPGYASALNHHIWCIEIPQPLWTHLEDPRWTITFDVLKFGLAVCIYLIGTGWTITFDVLKYGPDKWIVGIGLRWTITFDVLKLGSSMISRECEWAEPSHLMYWNQWISAALPCMW